MIAVLEGPNKCGKTTLGKSLQSLGVGFTYFRDRQTDQMPKGLEMYTTLQMLKAQFAVLKSMKEYVIVDRFHLTEYVYGYINRGYKSEDIFEIDTLLALSGAKLIYTIDSIENINKRNGKDMSKYIELFNFCYNASSMQKIKVNINKTDLGDIAGWLS